VVDRVVSKNTQQRLPIRLISLPDMKLIHISDMQKFVQPVVDREIENLRGLDSDYMEEKIEDLTEKTTAFAIFSHRWSIDELTLQDVAKIATFSKTGIDNLIKSQSYKGLDSGEVIDKVKEFSEGHRDVQLENTTVLENLKKLEGHIPHCTGLVKLVNFCELAMRNGCKLAWFDTCCIDKASSAEIEESIRSMFRWYQHAKVCIVHLAGTRSIKDMEDDPWFTRGWTLQELLAPKALKFYFADWRPLSKLENDKVNLWEQISRITGISKTDLLHFKPGTHDIRRRMRWASKRSTTRVEDMAYCLIGIFDVSLRIAYGEGKVAFHRLQAEILERCHDRGLFLWNGEASAYNSMLAAGPECFSDNDNLTRDIFEVTEDNADDSEDDGGPSDMEVGALAGRIPFSAMITKTQARPKNLPDPTYTLTNHGLRIPLALYTIEPWDLSMRTDMCPSEEASLELDRLYPNEPVRYFKYAVLGYCSSLLVVIKLEGKRSGPMSHISYSRTPEPFIVLDGLPILARRRAFPEIVFVE
jgi:Heterokaryon incompatibility protein (HET)